MGGCIISHEDCWEHGFNDWSGDIICYCCIEDCVLVVSCWLGGVYFCSEFDVGGVSVGWDIGLVD